MNQTPNNGGGRGKPMAAAVMFPSRPRPPPAVSSGGAASPIGLSRYDSAPGSFLAESIVGGGASGGGAATEVAFMGRFLSTQSPCITSESSCKPSAGSSSSPPPGSSQRLPYMMNEFVGSDLTMGTSRNSGGGGSPLTRQSTSPAGFLSRPMVDNVTGFSGTRDTASYYQAGTDTSNSTANRRLQPQLSFSNRGSLSQKSEFSISDIGEGVDHSSNSDENAGNVGGPYVTGNFIGSWDESNSIMFSSSTSKRAKDANGDIITISNLEPGYGAKSSLDMSTVEKYLQMQHDEVQFKVRAKRGCATHPRSIAERERRTRISEKLRRLQELVPNMDKQTNTADMLDLALQHIKGLRSQVQILTQEQKNCTCSGRK